MEILWLPLDLSENDSVIVSSTPLLSFIQCYQDLEFEILWLAFKRNGTKTFSMELQKKKWRDHKYKYKLSNLWTVICRCVQTKMCRKFRHFWTILHWYFNIIQIVEKNTSIVTNLIAHYTPILILIRKCYPAQSMKFYF